MSSDDGCEIEDEDLTILVESKHIKQQKDSFHGFCVNESVNMNETKTSML